MNPKNHSKLLQLCVSVALCGSCSSPSPAPPPDLASNPQAVGIDLSDCLNHYQKSSIDIEYVFDRDKYRLTFKPIGDQIFGKSTHDGKLIQEAKIQPNRYQEFLKKTAETISGLKTKGVPPSPCYGPFSLTLKIESKIEQVNGCRSQDPGSLSRLIREGEFLLYSKS
jgi:hypothetical protein